MLHPKTKCYKCYNKHTTKFLETNLSNSKKKYVCIPRSFLVINVCNQGKNLYSPCILHLLLAYSITQRDALYRKIELIGFYNREGAFSLRGMG